MQIKKLNKIKLKIISRERKISIYMKEDLKKEIQNSKTGKSLDHRKIIQENEP